MLKTRYTKNTIKFVLIIEKTLIQCVYCPVAYLPTVCVLCATVPILELDTQQLPLIWLQVTRHLHLRGGSPHGMTKCVNCGKWVLNVVTSDTTTHYSGLYIYKNCITQQEAQRSVVTERSDGTNGTLTTDGQNR
jgi:hypothetical protein